MQASTLDFSDTKAITCPSGLAGVVRNMTVGESRVLTGKQRDTTAQLNNLLAACWVETTDNGPYAFDDGKVRWNEALQGDRFFALLQIRILTCGSDYDFSVPCQNRDCGRRIDWSLKLDDLPVRQLSEESRAKFAQGNRFEVALPGGYQGTFGLATGHDETRLAALQTRDDGLLLPTLLNTRLREIQSIPANQKAAYLNRLSMRHARDLITVFEQADCGVETDIDIECPHCSYTQRVGLPLDQGFLWPRNPAPSSRSVA